MSIKDRLLEILKLNIEYIRGEKDWLYYLDISGNEQSVLDVAGSYGINLLGFSNDVYKDYGRKINEYPPNFIQGSISSEKQKLSKDIISRISLHTNSNGWKCEYSNTGTEIIEISLKLMIHNYQKRKFKLLQDLYFTRNSIQTDSLFLNELNKIDELIQELETNSYVLHFKNSFHGKTLGSLSIMGNPYFKKSYPSAIQSIESDISPNEFIESIKSKIKYYPYWDSRRKKIVTKSFLPIISIFLEPIQGEAGVNIMSKELLSDIQRIQKEYEIPVISDEIQCGLYRTGTFSALASEILVADMYCFGKSIGAGLAKLSILCCSDRVYHNNYFLHNSSSFGEDEHSIRIARMFLNLIDQNALFIKNLSSNKLKNQLINLMDKYPQLIKEVRGVGHMLAIELSEDFINRYYITKFFKDLNLLSYWISSIFLNKEKLRIFPSLSNPLTFRIQPSIFFGEKEINYLLNAFESFFQAILDENIEYLFADLFKVNNHNKLQPLPSHLILNEIPEGAAVFICHPIDADHVRNIIDLFHDLSDEEINTLLDEWSEFQEFSVYHIDKLTNSMGDLIDVVFLGVPMTSLSFYRALKNGKREDWIRKIQNAVDWANHKNAKSIGLGQYTSILTQNGLRLNSPKSILTTGNSYTAYLAFQALLKVLFEKKHDLSNISCCLVGVGGNIMSVLAIFAAEKFCSVHLIYHSCYKTNLETKSKILSLLNNLSTKNINLKLKSIILGNLYKVDDTITLEDLLNLIKEYLTISNDISNVQYYDVVVVGTNDPNAILGSEHIKMNAIIVDISVPPNCTKELQDREDIYYIKGGIASLPKINKEQELNSVILPLSSGECYACMGETFGLAFNKAYKHQIGDISYEDVVEVGNIMRINGFGLKRLKNEDSI